MGHHRCACKIIVHISTLTYFHAREAHGQQSSTKKNKTAIYTNYHQFSKKMLIFSVIPSVLTDVQL